MRLVPVFTQETNNQTNNECLPKFVQTDNASSSIKTAIIGLNATCNGNRRHKYVKSQLGDTITKDLN